MNLLIEGYGLLKPGDARLMDYLAVSPNNVSSLIVKSNVMHQSSFSSTLISFTS